MCPWGISIYHKNMINMRKESYLCSKQPFLPVGKIQHGEGAHEDMSACWVILFCKINCLEYVSA